MSTPSIVAQLIPPEGPNAWYAIAFAAFNFVKNLYDNQKLKKKIKALRLKDKKQQGLIDAGDIKFRALESSVGAERDAKQHCKGDLAGTIVCIGGYRQKHGRADFDLIDIDRITQFLGDNKGVAVTPLTVDGKPAA